MVLSVVLVWLGFGVGVGMFRSSAPGPCRFPVFLVEAGVSSWGR